MKFLFQGKVIFQIRILIDFVYASIQIRNVLRLDQFYSRLVTILKGLSDSVHYNFQKSDILF